LPKSLAVSRNLQYDFMYNFNSTVQEIDTQLIYFENNETLSLWNASCHMKTTKNHLLTAS
jgi:hypothetical protein